MNRKFITLLSALLLTLVFLKLAFSADEEVNEGKKDFPCKLVIYKNTCWKAYDLTIKAIDTKTDSVKGSVLVKKDTLSNSATFDCKYNEYLIFKATFEPPIWESDADKAYSSNKIWIVPLQIDKDAKHWEVSLCFPDNFRQVPSPAGELRDCACKKPKDEEAESKLEKIK